MRFDLRYIFVKIFARQTDGTSERRFMIMRPTHIQQRTIRQRDCSGSGDIFQRRTLPSSGHGLSGGVKPQKHAGYTRDSLLSPPHRPPHFYADKTQQTNAIQNQKYNTKPEIQYKTINTINPSTHTNPATPSPPSAKPEI